MMVEVIDFLQARILTIAKRISVLLGTSRSLCLGIISPELFWSAENSNHMITFQSKEDPKNR
jgi:hypothetical protein